MKTKAIFSMIALMAIMASLAVPGLVQAAHETIPAGETYTKSYDLKEFGWLSWSWTVAGSNTVDFWVEDSNGVKYDEEYDTTSDANLFTASEAGKYTMKWRNDGLTPVTVNYEVTPFGMDTPQEIISGMVMTAIIAGVIILVVIILIVVAVVYAGKKKDTPAAQQQAQQQQYQQQQYNQQQHYQQPYQQQPQQQYPPQPYPQQPQDPPQPQPAQQQYQQPYQQPAQQQYQPTQQQPPQEQYQPPQEPQRPPAKKQQYPPQE